MRVQGLDHAHLRQARPSRPAHEYGQPGGVTYGPGPTVVAERPAGVEGVASAAAADAGRGSARSTPLRVDAQRNLEHVLRAAREVFGESGYGAPMEDVARRARVGVGTVYRRFPSKEVLVRRIAREETARLAEQARAALEQEGEAWPALARFLRTSVASGAGRLLPPSVLVAPPSAHTAHAADSADSVASGREPGGFLDVVPRQRTAPAPRATSIPTADSVAGGREAVELLSVVGQLVDRARAAGELREDVAVADVLLVIATSAPTFQDSGQRAVASDRLLDILLEGLRAR
ncbi:TetR/AcrR family transcriptional regulator [Streptomyces alkaliterrae]|uniref:Helix-turn-helix transcriptional regulator n=1 Tax=Streptomyces alkaliterrae TaxID=2213162 RepID=A0A5P0YZK4_9ACTN|nr:helix-turn-helix domain-containing protein [Streptomyces alkaliterrae]MBB1255265.1 helix-turn-helix transcriptional regulator [Streptomyces alkaliterrae]MBB1259399.1 helix-turn-helix transcriptional regulator [Streptomyces alkaliterrae]MQS05107.1 TetR family transcriptional regulator [Streptomyces alkaliterrae]